MGAPLVANVVAKQLECGDRAVRALQRRGEVGASLGADVVLTQVECGDRALLKCIINSACPIYDLLYLILQYRDPWDHNPRPRPRRTPPLARTMNAETGG